MIKRKVNSCPISIGLWNVFKKKKKKFTEKEKYN